MPVVNTWAVSSATLQPWTGLVSEERQQVVVVDNDQPLAP